MSQFTHLHVHTQFSLLDGAASIKGLLEKTLANDMNSLAITDHGNMYGVLNFVNAAKKANVKPIVGCETYVAHNTRHDKKNKDDRSGYHLILLAKNLIGYKNLTKLISMAHKEGFYYKPRVDKELLKKYHEGLMASTACLGGEIPYFLANSNMKETEQRLEEYLDIFGDDFYIELQRHGLKEQEIVNKGLLELSAKYGIKIIGTNDVHFVNKEDSEAHSILIRLNIKNDKEDEKKMMYSGNEYLKTKEEMEELFADIPEAIINTQELADKVEGYSLNHPIVLPVFPIPEGFASSDDYLRHLTLEGAKKKYLKIETTVHSPQSTDDKAQDTSIKTQENTILKTKDYLLPEEPDKDLSTEVIDRIERELATIKKVGFAGYFLIVEDFIREAKRLGVMVGPGRGSAAGSIVAHCIGVTNIDPIRYNLLFERFINPERISMPDIDIDFDDENRDKVINYVIEKYGKDKVAQIITFGTMGPKMAIRDVARVLELPLTEADKLAKLVPEGASVSFKDAYDGSIELKNARDKGSDAIRKVLKLAEVLEGSIRNSGTHACGVIIGPDNLDEYVPLSSAKDSELMVTQYEGKSVESIGLLKMDFLGLKTLTIIKDAIESIRKKHGISIDLDNIPLNDEKTFELFKKGNTIGIFQFESDGMREYMKNLKPTDIEDLIAMNALYRPGPMNNIPTFINRKHGREKTDYPHLILEEILKPTYGVMVYQEQIMQISQRMAGFSGGKADELRKAMGKKQQQMIENLKAEFVEGAIKNEISKQNAEEVYELMSKFGQYGFNRSHSAAYSVIAYQTAYLKAHYPAEFMAAILTNNINDIKKITFYLTECKRHKISVQGPDINESELKFTVNSKGEIRFGLAAIKGVGAGIVNDIILEREKEGNFSSLFDLAKRVNVRTLNKKCLESLVLAGAFDSFADTHRAQYFWKKPGDEATIIEKVIKNASNYQNGKQMNQMSMFGEKSSDDMPDIELPECEAWSKFEILQKEKEIVGFYISGHPLDEYSVEIDNFCTTEISKIKTSEDLKKCQNKEIKFAGIITAASIRMTKKGDPFGSFTIEDYNDSISINLFKEDYQKFKHLLNEGQLIYLKAKVQARYNDEEQLELKILNICMLSEVMDKYANTMTLVMPLQNINDEIICKLNSFLIKNKGNSNLKFIITDDKENITIELPSRKFKININTFIKSISELTDLEFRLN